LPPGREDDAALEAALFQRVGRPARDLAEPDWAKVATELKRKGVTLVLLWQEYRADHLSTAEQKPATWRRKTRPVAGRRATWRVRSSDSWRVPWRIGPQGQSC
jgi:hypothetical protein